MDTENTQKITSVHSLSVFTIRETKNLRCWKFEIPDSK